jgi:hypothetical protein
MGKRTALVIYFHNALHWQAGNRQLFFYYTNMPNYLQQIKQANKNPSAVVNKLLHCTNNSGTPLLKRTQIYYHLNKSTAQKMPLYMAKVIAKTLNKNIIDL